MNYKKELNKMVWSFSRLHLYEQCPYAFYLNYIEKREGIDNFWAENGKAMHLTLEKVFKGEITLDEAPEFYMEEFDNICNTASEKAMETTFEACMDFLCEFDFDFFNDYEVIGVEKEVRFEIGGFEFKGFIDLLLKHKETGKITVLDYKSSPYPFKKDGKTVLKNSEENFNSYKHQMYLYSKAVIEEYGIQPSNITWLHFKDGKFATIDFNETEYHKSLDWASKIIENIYKDRKFEAKTSFVMCGKLCSYRDGDCEYKGNNESE